MALIVKPSCSVEVPAPAIGLRVAPACFVPTFSNAEQTFTASCPGVTMGDDVTVTIPAGQFTSIVSQEDADAQALAEATSQAEAALSCVDPCNLPTPTTVYSVDGAAAYNALTEAVGIPPVLTPTGNAMIQGVNFWEVSVTVDFGVPTGYLAMHVGNLAADPKILTIYPWQDDLQRQCRYQKSDSNTACVFGEYTLIFNELLRGIPPATLHVTYAP